MYSLPIAPATTVRPCVTGNPDFITIANVWQKRARLMRSKIGPTIGSFSFQRSHACRPSSVSTQRLMAYAAPQHRHQQIRPERDEELRDREDHLRLPRQLRVKLREHVGERRNHEHVQNRNRDSDRDQHERRITRGRLQSLDGLAFEFQILRDAPERFVEPAGVLADVDHRGIEIREHIGVSLQAGCEVDAAFEIHRHFFEHRTRAADCAPIPTARAPRVRSRCRLSRASPSGD